MKSFRNVRRGVAIAVVAAAAWGSGPAKATPGTPKVEVSVHVEKEVVRTDGEGRPVVERKPVSAAAVGDVLVYTLRARNTGDGAALSPRLEDPIPPGTVLVLESLSTAGGALAASVDGGSSWQPFPATVARKSANGQEERIAAPAESYTHLRWVLAGPLKPGEGKEVSFKVRVR